MIQTFSPKQRQVLGWWRQGAETERLDAIICDGAVRSGKTLCLGLSFLLWAMTRFHRQQFALCGKTTESVRRNLLSSVLPMLEELGFTWEEKISRNWMKVRFGGRENTFYLFGGKDEGLAGLQTLLGVEPGARTPEELRLALAALLRIGGDSFTLAAMNDTLRGCGISARVAETGDPLHLVVSFPGIGGVPPDFGRMQTILEAILPCHVWVEYTFSAMTWAALESRFQDWDSLEGDKITWTDLEDMVV